jgi:hypothetical protein
MAGKTAPVNFVLRPNSKIEKRKGLGVLPSPLSLFVYLCVRLLVRRLACAQTRRVSRASWFEEDMPESCSTTNLRRVDRAKH